MLDRPRDAPVRTAIGFALLTFVFLVFLAGASDRVYVLFRITYSPQIWVYRVIVWVGPLIAALVAYRVCVSLQEGRACRTRTAAGREGGAPSGRGTTHRRGGEGNPQKLIVGFTTIFPWPISLPIASVFAT